MATTTSNQRPPIIRIVHTASSSTGSTNYLEIKNKAYINSEFQNKWNNNETSDHHIQIDHNDVKIMDDYNHHRDRNCSISSLIGIFCSNQNSIN